MTGRTIANAGKTDNASRTPGKQKGSNCQASQLSKHICKRNRSYKHRDYPAWCSSHNGKK